MTSSAVLDVVQIFYMMGHAHFSRMECS